MRFLAKVQALYKVHAEPWKDFIVEAPFGRVRPIFVKMWGNEYFEQGEASWKKLGLTISVDNYDRPKWTNLSTNDSDTLEAVKTLLGSHHIKMRPGPNSDHAKGFTL